MKMRVGAHFQTIRQFWCVASDVRHDGSFKFLLPLEILPKGEWQWPVRSSPNDWRPVKVQDVVTRLLEYLQENDELSERTVEVGYSVACPTYVQSRKYCPGREKQCMTVRLFRIPWTDLFESRIHHIFRQFEGTRAVRSTLPVIGKLLHRMHISLQMHK